MPVTIWEPARYAEGFAHDSYGQPINGALAAAPHDKDVKVCEICAFDGWKESHYCDCGEFEITTADVSPEHIKRGNFVNFDGDFFIIEDYEWEIVDGVYTCTFSGRDFWKFPNSEVSRREVGTRYGADGLTGAFMMDEINRFFFSVMFQVGWFRDQRRFPTIRQNEAGFFEITTDATGGGFASKSAGIQVSSDVMSHGAEWRLFANMLQCGLRFDVAFNENKGLFEVLPAIYSGTDRGVVINSRSAGVSGFKFGFSGRGEVNAVYSVFKSGKGFKLTNREWRYESDQDGISDVTSLMPEGAAMNVNATNIVSESESKNFAGRIVSFGEVFSDLGDIPSEVEDAVTGDDSLTNPADYDYSHIENWAIAEMEKALVKPSVSFEFSYNDSGAYRFGKHFNLGDKVTLVDDYLGVSSSQRLTTVKTVYAEGSKRYEFEFTNQRISQSEALKRRFYELNRRTLSRGKL
jgi:hypothetical protein